MQLTQQNLKIVIANIGKLGVDQSYKNIEVAQCDDINTPSPLFFNTIYDDYNGDIYLFLTREYQFSNIFALEQMASVFNEYQQFVGVYSDVIENIRGQMSIRYAPAYDRAIIESGNIINNPIAFTKKCRPVFDINVKCLCYHQVLKSLGYRFLFCHVPSPLFIYNHDEQISQQQFMSDINIIKQY